MSLDEKLAGMIEVSEKATPGEWVVYEGCSWRRIGTRYGHHEDVLTPCIASDGHPDLSAAPGNDVYANLAHIAQSHPAVFIALCEVALAAFHWRDDEDGCPEEGLREALATLAAALGHGETEIKK